MHLRSRPGHRKGGSLPSPATQLSELERHPFVRTVVAQTMGCVLDHIFRDQRSRAARARQRRNVILWANASNHGLRTLVKYYRLRGLLGDGERAADAKFRSFCRQRSRMKRDLANAQSW